MMPRKVNNTLVDCLQHTLTLRLDGTPPADAAAGMMTAWKAAFNNLPKAWDEERDSQRLQQAFATFWANAERFPTPRMILDCMPRQPPPVPVLPHKLSSEEVAENRRQIKVILNRLTKGKTL